MPAPELRSKFGIRDRPDSCHGGDVRRHGREERDRDGSQDPEPPEKEGYPRRSQASFQQAAGGEDGTYPAGGSGRHRDRDRDGDRDVPRVSPDSVKVGRLNRPFARMQLRR